MVEITFNKSVFINCPLDEEYEPILQAILFCLIVAGYTPRIAVERRDAGENRLSKIKKLIESSKYSIHDLSRCKAQETGEFFRMNMPFELGYDLACRDYNPPCHSKKLLILEEDKYDYQKALSDISGFDIDAHGGDFQNAVRAVRNWLVSEAGTHVTAPNAISNAYADFQEWYFERQLSRGFSEEDIKNYPTIELLNAMNEWIDNGKPI